MTGPERPRGKDDVSMTINEIETLAKLMRETGLTSLEWSEGDSSLKLGRETAVPSMYAAETHVVEASMPVAAAVQADEDTVVKAPMVGVLYLSPSPEASPYVSVGDKGKKGDVLCIIEAMKLMNEITAEQDGEVVDICVKSGDVVEFGQPLFKIF